MNPLAWALWLAALLAVLFPQHLPRPLVLLATAYVILLPLVDLVRPYRTRPPAELEDVRLAPKDGRGLLWVTELLSLLNPFTWAFSLGQILGQVAILARYHGRPPKPEDYAREKPVRLPFPGPWLVANGGPDPATSHSWGLLSQRYAYDFLVLDEERKSFRSEGRRIYDYYAFGQPVLAPERGVVVRAQNRHHDWPILQSFDPLAWNPLGNYVLIKLDDNRYALAAHLKKGSVRVRPGDRVEKGQEIGRVGNSGRSTQPHLHFQFLDRPSIIWGMALPLPFGPYRVRGKEPCLERGLPRRGEEVNPGC